MNIQLKTEVGLKLVVTYVLPYEVIVKFRCAGHSLPI